MPVPPTARVPPSAEKASHCGVNSLANAIRWASLPVGPSQNQTSAPPGPSGVVEREIHRPSAALIGPFQKLNVWPIRAHDGIDAGKLVLIHPCAYERFHTNRRLEFCLRIDHSKRHDMAVTDRFAAVVNQVANM